MTKFIEIATSTGILSFTIEKETKENIFIAERSLLNKKLRYSKKEGRLENMINGKWDVYITEDCIFSVNIYEENASVACEAMNDAENLPPLVPMPGTEDPNWGMKAAGVTLDEEENSTPDRITGNEIIEYMAKSWNLEIKKTRKGELWISLNPEQYADVLDYLLHNVEVKHLRWETKRGSKKSRIYDEDNGTELILKNGNGAYLWCTHN